MKKIGICFPEKDFLSMDFEKFKNYILLFKENGLYSFDIYTSLIISGYDKINELLIFLNNNDIKITFHYAESKCIDEKNILKSCIEDLISVRNKLDACHINYHTTIVFHAQNYAHEYQKYEHLQSQILFFKELCKKTKELNFDILVETLSNNHPIGNHIGDDYIEIENLIDEVNQDNFGICWDIGHTRLNSLEEYSNIYLPMNIMNKVKHTHIHSFSLDDGIHEVLDHLPLLNDVYKNKELKYLQDFGYDGVYSIETDTNNLSENINIYLDSIKLLNNMLDNI
ncbi:MAG: TIM barrel protein [Ignavibacteriales bacterium]